MSRFKGLGEMNPVQLWETTLNPDARRLLTLRTDDFSGGDVREVFNKLMAKSEAVFEAGVDGRGGASGGGG